MSLFTHAFWRAAGERAIKSAAQVLILTGVGAVGFDAFDADWRTLAGAALGAAVLSLLTSIASDALTDGSGPSLTNAEVLPADGAVPDERGESYVGLAIAAVVFVILVVVLLRLV